MKAYDATGRQIKVNDRVALLRPVPGAMVGRVIAITDAEIIIIKADFEIGPEGQRRYTLAEQALTSMVLVLK